MATAIVTLKADLTGLPTGSRAVQVTSPSMSAVGEELPAQALGAGETVIPLPPGTVEVWIVPPTNQPAALELRQATGVVGHPLHPTLAGVVTVRPGTTQIILNASVPTALGLLFL